MSKDKTIKLFNRRTYDDDGEAKVGERKAKVGYVGLSLGGLCRRRLDGEPI